MTYKLTKLRELLSEVEKCLKCYKEFDKYPDEDRVRIIKRVGDEGWTRMMGYGRRWAVETALSTFERQYGEYCIAKMESIEKELEAKAYIYNMLINL